MTARTGTGTVRALVVSWNGAHLLPACLDSLLAQTVAGQIDIVVVDNASTDGTADLLASAYPQVRVVHSPRNVGFAGGVALGSTGLDQQDLLLLNNDATLAPDAVAQLRTALHAPGAERVGAVTAKILLHGWFHPADEHTARTADRALRSGAGCSCRAGLATRARAGRELDGERLSRDGAGGDRDWLATDGDGRGGPDVWGFSGGAALLRRTALEEVGGFDPSLFLYYEDTDVAWRMRAAGWSIRYVAQAVADHRHAESSDAASPLFRFYNTRNSLVVVTRHAPAVMALRAWGRHAGSAGGPRWRAGPNQDPCFARGLRGLGAAAATAAADARRTPTPVVRSRP